LELLAHLCILAMLTVQFVDKERVEIAVLSLNIAWIVFYVIGYKIEGMRMQQFLSALFYLPLTIYVIIVVSMSAWDPRKVTNIVFTSLAALGWIHNVYYTIVLGLPNFDHLKITGPFRVGVRYLRMPKTECDTIVFYPIDESEYHRKIQNSNADWLNEPKKIINAMCEVYGGENRKVPYGFFRILEKVKLDCVLNGALAYVFASGEKKIRPIVFSHGLTATYV